MSSELIPLGSDVNCADTKIWILSGYLIPLGSDVTAQTGTAWWTSSHLFSEVSVSVGLLSPVIIDSVWLPLISRWGFRVGVSFGLFRCGKGVGLLPIREARSRFVGD